MTVNWQHYQETIANWQLSQRIILCLMISLLIVWLADIALGNQLRERRVNTTDELKQLEQTLEQQNAILLAAGQAMTADPDAALKQQISLMGERHQQLEQTLQTHAAGLVPASELVQIVHDVLKSNELLKLRELVVLPVEKIVLNQAEGSADNPPVVQHSVYKYTVAIKLSGRYFDVVNYLQTLETLPWHFYWQRIIYDVDQYPLADVDITLFTLSIEKGNLGV